MILSILIINSDAFLTYKLIINLLIWYSFPNNTQHEIDNFYKDIYWTFGSGKIFLLDFSTCLEDLWILKASKVQKLNKQFNLWLVGMERVLCITWNIHANKTILHDDAFRTFIQNDWHLKGRLYFYFCCPFCYEPIFKWWVHELNYHTTKTLIAKPYVPNLHGYSCNLALAINCIGKMPTFLPNHFLGFEPIQNQAWSGCDWRSPRRTPP